tara:strand:- start:515 stop:709 length:195 start_codon:yes stop_codon:yes gene_type:complete
MTGYMRTAHRWIAIAFTLAVIVNIAGMILGLQAMWIGFLALVPLIPLLLSGLYLFVLPYLTRRR